MKNSDLGIDNKTGAHQMALTPLEASCLEIMQGRGCGSLKAISAADMTTILFSDSDRKRDLRTLVNHLIMTHSLPIMCEAGVGGGYYLAGDPKEAERFKAMFRRRAMTGLVKASRGSKAAFVDMMAQYTLGFDEQETTAVIEHMRFLPENDRTPAWVQLVTKFLDRISKDPHLYAAEIRRIQHTYGDIFVPREKVAQLKEETAKFQRMLAEIA